MAEEQIPVITFGESDPPLYSYSKTPAPVNSSWNVEFFPGKIIPVHYKTQIATDFRDYLQLLDDGQPIAIDFEWQPDFRGNGNPIALVQLCSSKICLVIRIVPKMESLFLKEFLSSHSFYGKGCGNDKIKLRITFGRDFHLQLEDVEQTQLLNYNLVASFDAMVNYFAGAPTAQFKNKRISRSNWAKQLNLEQLLYAAFDVVSLYECYPNFPGNRVKRGLSPFEEGSSPPFRPPPPPPKPKNLKEAQNDQITNSKIDQEISPEVSPGRDSESQLAELTTRHSETISASAGLQNAASVPKKKQQLIGVVGNHNPFDQIDAAEKVAKREAKARQVSGKTQNTPQSPDAMADEKPKMTKQQRKQASKNQWAPFVPQPDQIIPPVTISDPPQSK